MRKHDFGLPRLLGLDPTFVSPAAISVGVPVCSKTNRGRTGKMWPSDIFPACRCANLACHVTPRLRDRPSEEAQVKESCHICDDRVPTKH